MKTHLMVITGVMIAGAVLMHCRAADPVATPAEAKPAAESKAAMPQAVYVCTNCHMMAMKAGKCAMCGKALAEKHMLGIKDGKAQVCECHAGCKCDASGVKDGKCACGKTVQEVSAKGMYVCACAGGKCCATISDKPGKCGCGEPLKKVE